MQMDLRLGAAVYLAPGGATTREADLDHVGTLTRVLVDEQGEVEEIVVRLDDGLEELLGDAREVRAPADAVVEATERRVLLRLASREELEALPEYLEEHRPRPGDRWVAPPGYTVSDLLGRLALLLGGGASVPPLVEEFDRPAGEHQIGLNAPALVGGTRIGEITRVLYEAESGRVRALVLRRARPAAELLVPAELVAAVTDDAVEIAASPEQLAGLEPFRP